MSTSPSYGICTLCGKRTNKAGMTRHLERCPAEHEPASGEKPARLFRLRIEDARSSTYWMDVEIKAGATLEVLDGFLRQIWLECCDHLSSFTFNGRHYSVSSPRGSSFLPDTREMRVKLYDILSEGTTFEHAYDFGSTTYLKLRVTGERRGHIGSESIRVVSRNEAPALVCDACDDPARWICTNCMYQRENPFFCETHAKRHECYELEMLLPVVNSPRMGVCGYTGPWNHEAGQNRYLPTGKDDSDIVL